MALPFDKPRKGKEKSGSSRDMAKHEGFMDRMNLRGGKMPMKGMGKKMKRGKC